MGVERRAGRKVDAVKNRATEEKPAAVPQGARQAGEVRARWAWAEAAIWTERMLTALEMGVKGGKWYSLMDKVYALPSLRVAFAKVKTNKGAAGVDHQTVGKDEAVGGTINAGRMCSLLSRGCTH